jgi:putative addiction module component (TIGR02574 family)
LGKRIGFALCLLFCNLIKIKTMAYDREELFNLPVEEKLKLVQALWDRIDEDLLPVTEEEIKFAQERLELHKQKPSEGLSWSEVKKKITRKYGF